MKDDISESAISPIGWSCATAKLLLFSQRGINQASLATAIDAAKKATIEAKPTLYPTHITCQPSTQQSSTRRRSPLASQRALEIGDVPADCYWVALIRSG